MKQQLARRLRELEAKYAAELDRNRVIRIVWATVSQPREPRLRKVSEVVQSLDSAVVKNSSESCDPLAPDDGTIDCTSIPSDLAVKAPEVAEPRSDGPP